MPPRKKQRSLNKMSRTAVAVAEKSHYGDEPDFTDSTEAGCRRLRAYNASDNTAIDTELAYLKSLNWYNICGDAVSYRKWITQYAKDVLEMDKHEIDAIRSYTTGNAPRDVAIDARIVCRGGADIVPETKQNRIEEFLKHAIEVQSKRSQKKQEPDESKSESSKKPSVQDRMKENAANVFGDVVEPLIDDVFLNEGIASSVPDMYSVLQKHDVSGRVALMIADLIEPTRKELENAIKRKDDDLVEGYSFLSVAKLKKVKAAIDSMIDGCHRLNDVSKKSSKASKPRKKKSAAKLLSNFKYKTRDDEYKTASYDPKKIIGASVVVLFNTKNRKATHLVAKDADGLTIKGASIVGFDADKCIEKTIRKPFEFLSAVNSKGKRATKKAFDEINAKNTFKNGKANEHVVIVSVIK